MRTSTALRALFAATALAGVTLATNAGAAQLLTNGSFEAPSIGTGNYTYPGTSMGTIAPVGATYGGWTYNNAALVNASGSNAWYGGSAPAGMDGVQFVALQKTGTLSQSFTANASTLHLSWLDAGRPFGMGDQNYEVLINGASSGGIFSTASSDPFGANTLTLGGLTAGLSYDLTFRGLVSGSDETAFIDNVSLTDTVPAPPPVAPSISIIGASMALGAGEFMIEDFDNPIASGFTFLQDGGAYVRSGALGLDPSVSAPPPGDMTNYETVLNGGHAVLTSLSALKSISLYMGSPDTYNTIKFSGADGFSWTLNGAQIFNNLVLADGNQSTGRRVSYNFGDYSVNKVEFFSTGNSFEFDSIAGTLRGGAVPEPATWAMMILGFGVMGSVLRRRRTLLTQA